MVTPTIIFVFFSIYFSHLQFLQYQTTNHHCASSVLGNNLYALIPIVVISGEDAPRPDRLGQRIRTTGSTKTTWRRRYSKV